jgi:hypothetical protein
MANCTKRRLNVRRKVLLTVGGTLAVTVPVIFGIEGVQLRAQFPEVSWEAAAGDKMAFATASIRRSAESGLPKFFPPEFPLDIGDAYAPTRGPFAFNFPLPVYIAFAYKIAPTQAQQKAMIADLPKWGYRLCDRGWTSRLHLRQ